MMSEINSQSPSCVLDLIIIKHINNRVNVKVIQLTHFTGTIEHKSLNLNLVLK